MIDWYPHIDVLKGANLLSTDDDTDEVAQVLYNHYKNKLAEKKNIVLLMGHGNPDVNYNANTKYSEVQTALHTLATNKNIFVGTVDYGEMLFWPKEEEEKAVDRIPVVPAAQMIADYPDCIYSQVMKYCQDNNLEPNEVNVYLAPFMSIAGDHAHNDLWGIEAIAENKGLIKWNSIPTSTVGSERLEKAGFKVDRTFEAIRRPGRCRSRYQRRLRYQGSGQLSRNPHNLGESPERAMDADAWENGEGYQPEA